MKEGKNPNRRRRRRKSEDAVGGLNTKIERVQKVRRLEPGKTGLTWQNSGGQGVETSEASSSSTSHDGCQSVSDEGEPRRPWSHHAATTIGGTDTHSFFSFRLTREMNVRDPTC